MASKTQIAGYLAVVAGCFVAGMGAGYFGDRVDRYAYDTLSSWRKPSAGAVQSVVVAIDSASLDARHGMQNIRSIVADALDEIARAEPKVVAVDVILHDEADPANASQVAADERLAEALRGTRNLILPSQLLEGATSAWEEPAAKFAPFAVAIGHVYSEGDRVDGVSRQLILERAAGRKRRWALSLEAFRVARGVEITDSPEDVEVGGTIIPAPRRTVAGIVNRPMMIRYLDAGTIPTVSMLQIGRHREFLRGKTVFLGVTDLAAAHDRLVNPYRQDVPGVEVHAQAFETMARGEFLANARDSMVLLVCAGIAAIIGVIFAFIPGWPAYVLGAGVIGVSSALPYVAFREGIVFPFLAPVAVAWLTSAGAASYQHFFVRRQLARTESEKSRYQQAIHWAAHEMRTPLTAIQGSSEIMSRYKLSEEKLHQLSGMINSESKRLSRIIQTFLDVERLAEGQMELKKEAFAAADIVQACMIRVTPIAERKNISLTLDTEVEGGLVGDRELMEYAFYNLLTNALKYSAAETEVHVTSKLSDGEIRLAVRDQGIGMDSKEQKKIFQKFYRTKSAEASGEVGTGIGLSIVDQIVAHHGGRIDVTSAPGKGSCFTMVLRAQPQ